ncbi:hypothetical protein E2C01_032581 [Portunus trituberculatus]|uniref:Uncharacterized protein n=1 Tax=Portunus trituberculatus TaxID=210409 RepID=A0A5B7EXW5_PORTR|nr:hypothetical protein [Portunus trituberculatus]
MISPQLEYAAVVWSPSLKKDIRTLEWIQKISKKMVPELKDFTYEEQLKEMGLPTLQNRRERGDLITMYKLVNGIEKIDKEDLVLVTEEDGRTRGHVKIRMRQCVKDVRKYRTVEKWNALSGKVVTPHNVHNFREKLDKWRQDTMSPTPTLYNTTR